MNIYIRIIIICFWFWLLRLDYFTSPCNKVGSISDNIGNVYLMHMCRYINVVWNTKKMVCKCETPRRRNKIKIKKWINGSRVIC